MRRNVRLARIGHASSVGLLAGRGSGVPRAGGAPASWAGLGRVGARLDGTPGASRPRRLGHRSRPLAGLGRVGMGLLGTAFVRCRPAERLPRSFRAPGAQLRRRRERGAHPGLAGPPSGVEACVRRTRSTSGRSVARRPAGLVQPTHGTGKLTLRELLPSDRDVDRMHALPTMPARSIGPERRLPSASSRVAERSSRTPSPRGGPRHDSPFRSASASGQLAPGEHEQAAGGPGAEALHGPWRDSPFRSASASGQLAPGEHEQAAGGPAGGGPARPVPRLAVPVGQR
jgi:hypothetical protein